MFGTIRKHSSWMWGIIIVGIIVSFVIYFSPNVSLTGRGQPTGGVVVAGRNFSRDEINQANRELAIAAALGMARQPETEEETRERVLQRLLLQVKVAQYGISVGPEATAAWIRDNIMREGGPLAGMTFDQVADQLKKNAHIAPEDLTSFARHQSGIELLVHTITAAADLITPQEITAAYLRENEKITVDVASVTSSNFLSKVTIDPAELMKFYTNRMAAYRSPDRVQVHYVRFASSNYVDQAEKSLNNDGSLDKQVAQTYQVRGTNYYKGLSEDAAKGRIRQEITDQEAFKIARRDAYDFINKYYDSDVRTAEVMEAQAKAAKLTMATTSPFSRDELPEGLGAGPEFVDAAFKLTPQEPFSTAVSAADGFYALCYDKKIPGAVQPFDQVKAQVEKDYRNDRAASLAHDAAEQLYRVATNSVAGGQPFVKLAELSGFKVSSLTNLTMRTTSEPGMTLPVDVRQIYAAANNMETNSVSRPQSASGAVYLLHTGGRTPPTPEELAGGLASYRATIHRAREAELINDWISRQMESSGVINMLRKPSQ